ATINALKVTDKKMENLRTVIVGAGAAGMAITRILLGAGVEEILVCDREGIINQNERDLDNSKSWLAQNTNPANETGNLMDATNGADLLIGVSGPGIVPREAVKTMADDPVVFALANPIPEIMPEEIHSVARIIATGRSDYPNQINNVLAFPGLFRGALDAKAIDINEEMKLAAAYAIANSIDENDLSETYIIPSVFNKRVSRQVARKVKKAAQKSGVAGM
ncbi:MAG TPA: NAD-dependent malic enzyme, partial [Fodinibius sp.]|nr:NAD-dependent malic enzyme [Fodinibius sp.]